MLPNLRLFLSPSLLALRLGVWALAGSDLSVLSSLGTQCPLVRTAIFWGHPGTAEVFSAVTQAICGWRHLQELYCSHLNPRAWAHLLETGRLRSGAFRPSDPIAALATSAKHMALFPEMSDLHVTSRTVTHATDFIKLMHHTPRMCHLSIESTRENTPQNIHALCVALSNRVLDSDSPEVLRLSGYDSPGTLPPTITFETMQPLLSFRDLRVLKIERFGTFALDDEALKVFAMAWPNLEILRLEHNIWPRPLGITFRGLSHLVRFCPNLKHLTLAFDATKTECTQEELGGASNCAIKWLDLLNSPLSDVGVVAALLKCLFPQLERCIHSPQPRTPRALHVTIARVLGRVKYYLSRNSFPYGLVFRPSLCHNEDRSFLRKTVTRVRVGHIHVEGFLQGGRVNPTLNMINVTNLVNLNIRTMGNSSANICDTVSALWGRFVLYYLARLQSIPPPVAAVLYSTVDS
ncbi:hypothetical protein BJ138DRAFT_1182922 [Hygrophoropsis aurantiaca]|uniref:Uncharacterized protein n=1 Tax=Hygrophoropsis aurantiaca TaxID=72124 RepID=A0ACB8A0H4_9AGAM|nr:hypothetical protein BJ138DRAFT_1182922 [Hygrophoropsis aurantiaca]